MEPCPAYPKLKSFNTAAAVIVACGAVFVVCPVESDIPVIDQATWSDGTDMFWSDFAVAYWAF